MITLGAHLSASKGFVNMYETALSIGANTFQFFTRNPRGGKAKDIDIADIDEFLKLVEAMEGWFTKLRTADDWHEYNQKYGDFNRNYHDKIRELAEKINNCSFEYADRSKHGWCL